MTRSNPQQKRTLLKRKIRARISGTKERPRLSVFRSNNFLYAQLIDDTTATTILAVNDRAAGKGTKVDGAQSAGTTLAAAAKGKGITSVVFDRNGFRYAGRIKAFADAARAGGLNF